MLTRLRNVWRPENFHFHHRLRRGRGEFEGWYFKLVDAAGEQPCAVIPGVFLGEDAHAFVQLLDGRAGRSAYHRFPLEAFRADRRDFSVEIGRNRFSREGISLAIEGGSDGGATGGAASVRGAVRFSAWQPWPVTLASPGVMGPYGFVPFLECNHGILSLDHALEGALALDGRETRFDGGRGYVEKDWGRSFPSGYVWTQSNHFGRAGTSVTASVARIPWLTGAFRGFLVGFLHAGRLHRFTTWTGARIEGLALDGGDLELCVANREHRLEIRSRKTEGAILHAPYERRMMERVAETMTSEIALRLASLSGDVVYEGRGRHACLELQGDLPALLRA